MVGASLNPNLYIILLTLFITDPGRDLQYKKNKNNNTFHAIDVIFFECFIYHDHIYLNLNHYNYLFYFNVFIAIRNY